MEYVRRLRELASWYRELANCTENQAPRESRLRAARLLDRKAVLSERAFVSPPAQLRSWGVRALS